VEVSFRGGRRLGATLLLTAVVTVMLGTSTAIAAAFDNIYPTIRSSWVCDDDVILEDFCLTDGSTVTVYFESTLDSTETSRISTTLALEYAPTDLSFSVVSSPDYSGSDSTNTIYQQVNSGFGSSTYIGYAWCDEAKNASRCYQHYVRFRYSSFTQAVACHETGHSVGLTHGQGASPQQSNTASALGCMRTPILSSYTDLKTDSTQNINAVY